MPKQLSPITPDLAAENLQSDLEGYAKSALFYGADNAAVIEVGQIPVEDGVANKCRVPRCYGYGQSANCPPHSYTPLEFRELLGGFKKAILFRRVVPNELLQRDRKDKERRDAFRSIYEIAGKVEGLAFSDGHPLAFGLAAGSCKTVFCGVDKTCQALEGKSCLFSGKSRPSMEGVGINVYRLVAQNGWDIFPIGAGTTPEEASQANLVGLVVVQ